MSGASDSQGNEGGLEQSGVDAELRTIAFRLREIQRLLAMRVEQENARLEADGIDPVESARFFKQRADRE